MKTYKVLEAHQGDKFYVPGDPETGTRIADPNAVQHLVTLGLLEEIGEGEEAAKAVGVAGVSVADLQAQVTALTQERDEARSDLNLLREQQRDADGALSAATARIEALTEELAREKEASTEADETDPVPGTKPARTRRSAN